MTTRTSEYKIGTFTWSRLCLLIVYFLFSTDLFAQTVPLSIDSTLKAKKTGVIRAMEVVDSSTYLAAENGFYKITGANSEVISLQGKSKKQKGILSDLVIGNDHTLYISEFGVGIYRYDIRSGKVTLLNIPSSLAKDAWRIAYSEDRLFIAAVSGYIVFDIESGEVLEEILSSDNRPFKKLYEVVHTSKDVVVFSDQDRLIFHDLHSASFEIREIKSAYPKLSSVTALYSHGLLYIGGPEGVYVEDFENETSLFYSYEKEPDEEHWLRSIFVQQNGRVWIAADGLHTLSHEKQKIVQPDYLQPILSSYAINTVIDLDETASGQLLIASTQQGLLVLPPAYDGIQFLHIENSYFHKSRASVFSPIRAIDATKPVLLTTNNAYSLSTLSGELTEIDNPALPAGPPVQRKCWMLLQQLSIDTNVRDKCWQQGAHLTAYDSDKYLLYTQQEQNGQYLLIEGNSVVDTIDAPTDLISTLQLASGALVALDEFGRLHVQMSRFSWKMVPTEAIGSYIINCLIEWQPDIVWLCTSGNGVVQINLENNDIQPVEIVKDEELRFVRAGVKGADGNMWLATNKGLVVFNPQDKTSYMLGEEDGITDVDFHYDGMYLIDDSLILMGDKYAYLLNTRTVLASLAQQSETQYSVKFLSISSEASDGETINYAEAYNGQGIRLTAEHGPLSVVISPTNYTFRHRQRIEYRVKGVFNEWRQSDNPYATITFSGLERPYYEIEARVVDGRSNADQPVTSISVHILPPFYFTWQAYLVYTAVLIVFGFHVNRRYQARLRDQVSQFTAEVFEQKRELASSQKSIRHLVDGKQRLFTNISHEIKTPLALIVGVLRQLPVDEEDERQLAQMEIVYRNSERVECLVEQIVELEKLDSVRDLPRRKYDVGATANAIVQSFAGLIEQKSLDVDVKTSGRRAAFLLEDSLEQILSNLLGNAIKYTADGGHILISILSQGPELRIRVKDTGIGIDDEHKKSIFERFTRVEELDGVKGVGVGLALINEIVKANGGWIEVKSDHGKGSCFTVHLPQEELAFPGYLKEQDEEQPSVPELPEVIPADVETCGRHRILIVEDDRDFRTYVYDMTSKYFSCFTARNGRTAIDVFNTVKPHLVITDFRMPDMDGIALARYIRTKSDAPQTPIILLTAHNSNAIQKQRFTTVVDCMLNKSLLEGDLIAHIRNLISLRELTEQHLAQSPEESKSLGYVKEPIPHFANEKDQVFYTSLQATLEKRYADVSFNRAAAAKALNMSERQLNRRMAVLYEHNFAEHLKRFRIQKAKLLLCGGRQITATAMDVGFCTASYFSSCFKNVTGLSPRAYQEANRGAEDVS